MMETTELLLAEHLSQGDLDPQCINQEAENANICVDLEQSDSSTRDDLMPKDSLAAYSFSQSAPGLADAADQLEYSHVSLEQSEEVADANRCIADLTADVNIQLASEPVSAPSVDKLEFQRPQDMDTEKPSAFCKYRWTKISDTETHNIGFYPSYAPNAPVLLSWHDKALAYFSNDLRISCGDYHGTLVVDGKVYPVDDFSVRSYTFEVDLFIKDADEMPTSHFELEDSRHEQHNDVSPIHSNKDVGSLDISEPYTTSPVDLRDLDSKVASEDVLTNEYQRDCHDKALSSSKKSNNDISLTGMKRDSPVGNDGTGQFSEYSFHRTNSDELFEKHHSSPDKIASSEALTESLSEMFSHAKAGTEVVEDVVRPSSKLMSEECSGSKTRIEVEESLQGSRPPSIGADSVQGSHQNSLKHSLSMDSIYGRPHSKASDRFSPDSFRNGDPLKGDSSRYKPSSEQVSERSRASASPAQFIQATSSKERNSPVLGSSLLSPRVTHQKELIIDTMYASKGAIPGNGERVGLSISLSGRPPTHPGSRSGSLNPSRTQSLNSMTSDQELSQLFEHSRPSSAASLPPGAITIDPTIKRGAERSANLPSWVTESQVLLPSGEFIPLRASPSSDKENLRDLHSRSSSASRVSSHVNSHTTTSVPVENRIREVSNDRIQELEASVANLRKLLASREAEVHSLTSELEDLKDINRSLREELDHRGRRHTPVSSLQDSFEFKQLQSEKEILASEVVTLRDKLQRLSKGQSSGSGGNLAGSGITDYSPNSPAVLQRKIVDLEAHMCDLQEVTEATNSSLLRAEEKMKLLHDENRDLKLRASNTQDDHDLRIELRTLREDIRNLKERNYQLTEENMRLMEDKKSGSKDTLGLSPSGGSRLSNLRSDNAAIKQTSGYTTSGTYRYDTSSVTHGVSDRGRTVSASPVISKKIIHEDLAPRETKQSVLNQGYDLDQRVQESRLLQYRNHSDSSHLPYYQRDGLAGSKSTDSLKRGYQYSDRSTPDGEVSEKLHSDKYAKPVPSYEKRSYEGTRDGGSYLDRHSSYKLRRPRESTDPWSKEKFDAGDKGDKYRHTHDGLRDRDLRVTSFDRKPTGGAISSRDIFLSLQQKRNSQLLQQDNKYMSGNLDLQRYQYTRTRVDSPGDDSDTATDILISQDIYPRGLVHQRRTSFGSDGSPSSLSDLEDPTDNLLRKRSKSMDAKRGQNRQLSTLHRSESASRPLTSTEHSPGSVGFRSVIPPPLVTQHNKGEMTSKSVTSLLSSSLTQGLRPFAPRSSADIRIDDVVKFSRVGGKLSQGVVKYVGRLPGRSEAYLGVELDKDEGKHDGTFEGIRYFKCKPNKGVFVAFNKVVMAWAP